METRVFKYPNATVRVHIPNTATEEEKMRNFQELKKSAELLLREAIYWENTPAETIPET